VIGVTKSEQLFLALNGVDLTLELLLVVAPPQRKQLLGFLSDLLANSAAHQYLYEWEAPPGAKLPSHDGITAGTDVEQGSMLGATASAGAVSPLGPSQSGRFTALELLLSFWPSPSLLERSEKRVQAQLRYKSDPASGGGGSPLSPSATVPEEDSDMEDEHAFRLHRDEEEKESEEERRAERYAASLDAEARAAQSLPRVQSNQHLKPALYAIFSRLGFDGVVERDDADSPPSSMNPFVSRATPVQRATLYEISRFVDGVRAATLAAIQRRLEEEGVRLVASDAAFFSDNGSHLTDLSSRGAAFDESAWEAHQEEERAGLDAYLWQVTARKTSSEQFALANARKSKRQSMRRRLQYKEMREQMLRQSEAQDTSRDDEPAVDSEPEVHAAVDSSILSPIAAVAQPEVPASPEPSVEQQREDEEEDIEVSSEHMLPC
jgi:hypothetical protein